MTAPPSSAGDLAYYGGKQWNKRAAAAQKTLADGRNAHLSLYPQQVWVESLEAAGFIVEEQSNPEEKGHTSWFVVV